MALIYSVVFPDHGRGYYLRPPGVYPMPGDRVIAETVRGLEMGTVETGPMNIPGAEEVQPLQAIIRIATASDLAQDAENHEKEKEALEICQRKVEEHGLPMNLISATYTFDRSQLVFYFSSEQRVDFRQLVRDLAAIFHTRIQLLQIGARDEAKHLGGCGVCGRPLCCATWLQRMEPISIKMAKEQHLPLNPSRLAGACGRLKCCLRYEYDFYKEQNQKLPGLGIEVRTTEGEVGVVSALHPLKEQVTVTFYGGGCATCAAAAVCPTGRGKVGKAALQQRITKEARGD
ncbi:MAG: stage 0 sporulation family protein [Abditibacteriales bacterium]|nr:stage 0 sporulation family protein [Abditibacteriales bacterium]MDW8366736.1 stage 0 sporulation family protein [Abditibacteriales bacterium]